MNQHRYNQARLRLKKYHAVYACHLLLKVKEVKMYRTFVIYFDSQKRGGGVERSNRNI